MSTLQCPLCGGRFTEGERCGGCPLVRRCNIVCCPHCAYTFPGSSSLARWLGRWLHGATKGATPPEAKGAKTP